ncbi:PREDICTED: protein SZT2-like isoform X1 [Wasmannia auropunctata]|uniref:protein SZT2-like isoform X1 n=3 Tax=Wasmannia auropunctata TaxID=64793 RepID=UPI0005EE08BA|nr:PREDICTED: protein SZT2-like isoform X1 [Wasmannia auropunctata]
MASVRNEDRTVLEAETIFLLMKKGFPISRNVRAQWLLEHLDSVISIQCPSVKNKEEPELEVVSVLPRDKPVTWSTDTSHQFLYKVVSTTSIVFLAHKYRMVFSLDLSPSLATVDVQNGEIVIDEVCLATRRCLEGITRPFTIPGSRRVMQPEIYVTVIAHTPFFTSPAQQVLVQGWLITADNVNSLTQYVEKQLYLLEERVAAVTAIANQQLENLRAESERLVGRLFEESSNCLNKNNCNISIVSPEASFVNMLRYGMLALTLLPEHSCAHMVIVTDGIVGIKNAHTLDSIIQQLRATTVACSFLRVGSAYDPHCADGLVPNQDLLYFIAAATLGSYMSFTSHVIPVHGTDMNLYHKHFLCWQLYRDVSDDDTSDRHCWRTENNCFHGHKSGQLLKKKQIDDKVTCTLSSLLCCRLREGYLIKRASVRDDILEINFVLLWKTNVSLEYSVTCPWSSKSLSLSNVIQYTITIEAPYEFLHDITCLSKKPLNSHYRQGVISRFWTALTSLTESDNTLAHFSWFPGSGWTWYSVPDTIRSGMPVFYLSSYPSPSTVQLSDAACPQFGQIWQPVVSLDPLQWARWMHTQRITLILAYDRPLPRHLHQANQSGRFQCVQSRQAAAVLYAMLKNWATFVLVENHTYVQFIYREAEKPPVSFSLIRINCKALCVVLNIAFAGGTEGVVRHNVVVDLVDRLSKLTLPNRPTEQREIPCCTIIHKSLERILVRYERIPSNLSMVVFPDGTQPTSTRTALGGSLTTTLSRYLYHNRWLWHVKRPFVQTIPGITLSRLNITAIARILSTITKIRLGEGFNFAYSAAGITNMVLEVQMQGFGNDENSYPCIIQYVLFPPHVVPNAALERDSSTEDDTEEGIAEAEVWTEDSEGYSDFQIVTEVWVEPQCGYVQMPTQSSAMYMHPLQYHQLPDAIARIDEECINALLTLEYLSLLCQVTPVEKDTEIVFGQAHQGVKYHGVVGASTDRISECPNPTEPFEATPIIDERIHPMYFSFDTLSILSKCQQAELLFSMFADDSVHIDEDRDSANRILMGNFLEHMKQLHNKELLLTSAESQRFTKMLLNRPRENVPPLPFFMQREKNCRDDVSDIYPRWKCFVKGISTTHVIITILPATEKDVRLIMYTGDNCTSNNSEKNCDSDIFDLDMNEKVSSPTLCPENLPDFLSLERRESKISSQSTTANSTSKANVDHHNFDNVDTEGNLVIPVYVYDCSLALLIDALVGQLQTPQNKDIYQDHTFKIGEQISEDFVSLKSENNTKPSSPEPKSEDSDNISSDQRSLMEHCKLLSLAHCHCYVVAVYKSLALQQSLSYEDMEAAVAQCEENLIEINITNYLRSVCRHLSMLPEGDLLNQLKISACNDVKPLHSLIKNKFKKIMAVAFRPVPAHPEFYYCLPSWMSEKMEVVSQRTDSDDDLDDFTCHSEMPAPKTDNSSNQVSQAVNITWPVTNLHNNEKLSHSNSKDSLISDFDEENTWHMKDQPLFLHLSCSIRFRSELSSIPVKVMPTCFTEIVQRINDGKERNLAELSLDDLKVTLDIICLSLPREVLEVSLERYPALRTTSYCSASTFGSVPSGSSPSTNAKTDSMQERMPQLPQHHAVISLRDEIEWLLRDETATALLDHPSPNANTLKFIAQHVSESTGRSSCSMDKVPLHFVFPSESSAPKFLKELKNLEIDKYCICQEADLFYFVKKPEIIVPDTEADILHVDVEEQLLKDDESVENMEQEEIPTTIQINGQDSGDAPGYYSEISSIAEGKHGTDDGYEGDSSNSEDDYQWLIQLDKRRDCLPNFWLIMNVENNHVNVYFHCRFLELSSPEVDSYSQIQKMLLAQIKAICRRVNQYLLLQNLHDTRICDLLLEPESTEDYNAWRETGGESGNLFQNHSSSTSNVTPGMFRCPVIWEEPFNLHPRLKTGPGRSGLSRGIKALHGVLNRLSVNNRNNMFVYQENNENVFYLRLHEQMNDVKPLQNKLSESDEKLVVSRSNSIASLSQAKGIGLVNDHVIANDTRPRVRSFGEKESDILNRTGDSIILMVHGISEAGPEVKRDLVQVLQNRLDDAVLKVLSEMLARNPMCKLTPADVHFIQKPYKSPECIVQLSVQPHCLRHMDALGYYLRQNILQFLYTPKYTDLGAHYHFQDYTPLDGTRKRVSESDIFLYNQSHSSGSKGIACIALAITDGKGESAAYPNDSSDESKFDFPKLLRVENFESIVSTNVYNHKSDSKPSAQTLIEFRIWKQGRVNLESLILKLSSAVKHGTWDLVTEYNLLATPLTEPIINPSTAVGEITENKEVPTPVKASQSQKVSENLTINPYELGEKGKLDETYHTTLARWFQFALEMGVPAVKRHEVVIHHRHAIPVIVRELQNLIRSQDPDTSSKVFVLQDRQPFLNQFVVSHKTGSAPKWSDNVRNSSDQSLAENTDQEDVNSPVYVPHEFNKDEQTAYIKCILIARNFHQWKASLGKEIDPELLAPKDQKQLQKFNPLISESNFVPRQRILLAEILSDNIIIYMYNWSKEKSEKLIKQTTNLGTWLSSRSSLFTNIIMQKLGIFHHKLTREPQQRTEHGSQYYQINDMESLAKFPSQSNADSKDWTRSSNRAQSKNNAFSWVQVVGQAMRDAKPSASHSHNTTDTIVKAAYDLQDLRHREKKIKEDLDKLYAMWQSRTSNIPISLTALNTFKQHSRLIHFCHTPLLFLPAWRLQSAATRDHSLTPPQSSHFALNGSAHEQSSQAAQSKQEVMNAIMIKWHQELCKSMLSEYKQYLQILGFNPIQVESPHKTDEEHVQQQSYYLKKSMLGGILLFEVHLSQPFFIVKLHIIECNRLQTKTSSGMVNQFVLSFVDICDKIQINMHLHSFTYDFHLRCIHSYIAGTGLWSLQQGYHLTHFMDDFIKYYSKAPNYARNLIYSDVITIHDIAIPARTLYSYLLSHEKVYGMRVFVMSGELQESHDNEYVLIKLQSTPLVSYCDAHDTKCTDDFDVALIVSRMEQSPQIERTEITLKYYLMLTSKRELYPKREVENNKLGKFRTVYSVGKPSTSYTESPVESSSVSPTPLFARGNSRTELLSVDQQERNLDSTNDGIVKDTDVNTASYNVYNNSAPTPPPVPNSPLAQNSNISSTASDASSSSSPPHLVQIRQESVNYLGYYSSHEQLMQQMIMAQAKAARQHITNMVERGALQCRTHLLWDKLLESKTSMTYTEFSELCSLAHIEPLSNLDARLGPLVNQPVSWYQALSKVLQNKYQEHHKQFITSDGNVTHHLILHPTLLQAFMMLTIDMHTSRGDLCAVYRKSTEINMPMNMEDVYALVEGFVNACCFHLWMGLCSQ